MTALQEQIESLYQQASSEYLQGDFASALASWRELLALAPGDERAEEGCRLCEMLVQTEPEEGSGASEAPLPAGDPSPSMPELNVVDPAVDQGIEQSLEELDHLFEDGYPGGAAVAPADPVEVDSPGAAPTPPTAEAGGEAAQAASRKVSILEPPMFDLDLPEEPPEPRADPAAAASELDLRVAELVAEARQAYEAGDPEESRAVLQRVFILDETHAGAIALLRQLDADAGIETTFDPPAGEEVALDEDLFADPTPEEIAAAEAPVAPPPTVATPPEVPVETANLPAEPVDGESLQEELASDPTSAPGEAAPAAGKRSLSLPRLAMPQMPRWVLPALGAVVVLGIAAYFAMGFLGGAGSSEDRVADPVAASPTAAAAVVAEPVPAGPDNGPEVAEPAPAGPINVGALLTEADGQMQRGEYQAAILTFNRVLKAQPANERAIDGLTAAGDRYREQRAVLEKWETIRRLFDEQDYRTALTLMYRLPESEQGPELARYKRNGWYNMGLQSLIAADCDRALEHLDEADRIDPGDASVQLGITLAERCQDDMSPRAFAAAVGQLQPRKLAD